MSRKQARPPLLLRVWAELGAGGIIEDPTLTSDIKGERLEGLQMGRHIWVNPIWNTVDTCVHELLHRMHPEWSERYVRNRTALLMHAMTDAEVQQFYETYQRVSRKRKRRRRREGHHEDAPPGGRLVEQPAGEGAVSEVRGRTTGSRSD